MKPLTRPAPPGCFESTTLREWYGALRKKDGSINDRWNAANHGIRDALHAMSNGQCAWCGAGLHRSWHVDHWLPSEKFPRLAYCWANLLPACAGCNGRKKVYQPKHFAEDSIVDPALDVSGTEVHFARSSVHENTRDRLVDPTEDDPATHLEFIPLAYAWKPLTDEGTETVDHVLDSKEAALELESIDQAIQGLVRVANPALRDARETIATEMIRLVGRPVAVRALVHFRWSVFHPQDGPNENA